MEHRQAVAIVNPCSQNGALGRSWPEVARTLRREFGPVEHVMTSRRGDATRLAREVITAGADLVIAVGGDGTIHEVVNGFFDEALQPIAPEASLGVVPFGTGGDFRRTARIPNDLVGAARLLATGTPRRIDLGLLEYAAGGRNGPPARRLFVNIASFGLGGLVDRIVNQSSKALGGTLSFLLGTVRAVARYHNQRVHLTFDDNPADALEVAVNNVAVANGRTFGGGMRIAPEADLADGQFDVVIVGDLSKTELLLGGHRVYRGTHLTLPKVRARRATRIDARAVDPTDEVLLDVDGEALGALPASFRILTAAIRLVAPATLANE